MFGCLLTVGAGPGHGGHVPQITGRVEDVGTTGLTQARAGDPAPHRILRCRRTRDHHVHTGNGDVHGPVYVTFPAAIPLDTDR